MNQNVMKHSTLSSHFAFEQAFEYYCLKNEVKDFVSHNSKQKKNQIRSLFLNGQANVRNRFDF